MAKLKLKKEKQSIHFTEEQMNLRLNYKSAIQGQGFEDITGYGKTLDLWSAMTKGTVNPAAIVLCLDMDQSLASSFIRAIREREVGTNPFVPIILSSWTMGEDGAGRALALGADAYLSKPASTLDIHDLIVKCLSRHAPFVAVRNYVGPDRRRDTTRGGLALSVDPPNVAMMLSEFKSPMEIQKAIDKKWDDLCIARAVGAAFEVGVQSRMIANSIGAGPVSEEGQEKLTDISEMCEEALEGLPVADYAGAIELLKKMGDVLDKLLLDVENPSETSVKLLTPLSHAICMSVRPDMTDKRVEMEIAGWIERAIQSRSRAA